MEPEQPSKEESKTESVNSIVTKVISVGPPEKNKKKNIFVNTAHCRLEIDTVQYVINKYGYREVTGN